MTDLMSIGASGLRAYRDALGTTSDNIANAQTAGYVRRTLQLAESPGSGDMVLYRSSTSPSGVLVEGVQRSIDQWLVDDSRASMGNAERSSSRLEWLQASERALDDGESGVGQSLTSMFNAADALAADPANTAARSAFLSSVSAATDAFRQTATQLQSVATGIATAGQTGVDQVNSDVAALQRVNEGLLRAREGSTNKASLMDERDKLLDSLSGALPIQVTLDSHGAATVQVAGNSSATLLDGSTVGKLALSASGGGLLSFDVGGASVGLTSGSLSGLAAAASTVADARANVDQLAAQFASEVNSAHQAGKDANGNAGSALVNFTGNAASLTAVALTPDQVAAADATSDNGNMLSFAGLRGPTGTEHGWAQLVGVNAQTVSAATAEASAASTRRDGAMAARDAVSGVDLDHESAELLRFQQAYEGAARVIQVARDTFQSILSAL
jgi:flagellar hook-associated protein 1 FlgK